MRIIYFLLPVITLIIIAFCTLYLAQKTIFSNGIYDNTTDRQMEKMKNLHPQDLELLKNGY
jgi:hypothetical protein